jgi:hypothetical protein
MLLDNLAAAEIADLDRPHLVVCRDEMTGVTTYQGPYPNALSAVTAAQHEQDLIGATDEKALVWVAPLFAADIPPLSRRRGRP